MSTEKILKQKALHLRHKTFEMFIKTGEAHLGGSFSLIETLIFLFNEKIRHNKDKFILSKSHASYPLCILLNEKGLKTKMTTHLELDPRNGIYCTTGSLGHGLPIAAGMAFARKKKKLKGKIFVMISDGECQEGTTWETLLIASKHQLDNLVILIDYNKIQALTKLEDGLPLNNLSSKVKSFNCNSISVKNAHSFNDLNKSFQKIKNNKKPSVLILNTIKGKGIKKFENDPVWHARKLSAKDILIGRKDLKSKL